MERSLCAGRIPHPPGSRRRERPPYGAGETRRPPGKMQFPRYTVGADSISARFAAARGSREGHAPPLHGIRARPAKRDCRSRPGKRRAGCPHPAAPRGKAGFRGRDKSRPYGQILCFRQIGGGHGRAGRADMESAPTWGVCGGVNVPGFESSTVRRRERPPYGTGETRRPTGKMQFPRPLQTHVGDDACTAPAGAFRRPTGPQVRLLGRRSSRGVAATRGSAGGACPSPTCRPGTTGQMGLPQPPGRT